MIGESSMPAVHPEKYRGAQGVAVHTAPAGHVSRVKG